VRAMLALALSVLLVLPLAAVADDPPAATLDEEVRGALGQASALVHAADGVPVDAARAAAIAAGLRPGTTYAEIGVFVAYGPARAFQRLAGATDRVAYVEANRPLRWFTDTSHRATRGAEVLAGDITLPDGTLIDGSGVGVAVVDSGIDATHPDLADRVVENVRIVCTAPGTVGISAGLFDAAECRGPKAAVPLPDTDLAGGHGTHVAGTVAGTGAASDGRFHGAAPGASIYGVAAGTTLLVENGLDGLQWVLEHHDQVSPAIRVVNNSWGTDYRAADPEDPQRGAITKMQDALIEAGVVVVFAAGNDGGDGSEPRTSHQCVNRTPGNICVASYDDQNRGDRNRGGVSGFSSRGAADDAETWPSLMAPGTDITAACRATMPVCHLGSGMLSDPPNTYARLQGTSMAAPHVAGIAAQLLQVDPSLTPADVQYLLQDTAFKLDRGAPYEADPFNPSDSLSSFDKGHGLVDVFAAVEALLEPEAEESAAVAR
jgi:serine protease AprX